MTPPRPAGRQVRFRPPRGGASEQVARELRRYVLSHDLEPGDRLGTEQELAAEFGVSRPTLREALRLLAGSHLIRASTGPGGGIFVASTPNEGLGRHLSESIATMLETDTVSLDELIDARILLEVPIAGRAAANATPETAAELQLAIDAAAQHAAATPPFSAADARFHRIIAATAGNELLRGFTSWTLDVLQPSLIEALGETIDGASILDQHRAIRRGIQRKQPAAAERAMREHLEYMRQLVRAL
jgi:DNA-binding FadR family transcriptional regulator